MRFACIFLLRYIANSSTVIVLGETLMRSLLMFTFLFISELAISRCLFQAMLVFKKALKMDPSNAAAALALSELLGAEGSLDLACAW